MIIKKSLFALMFCFISMSSYAGESKATMQVGAAILPSCNLSQTVINNKVVTSQHCNNPKQYPVRITEKSERKNEIAGVEKIENNYVEIYY